MNHPLRFALPLCVAALAVTHGLGAPLENEFLQLRQRHDQVLATVAEPIDDGYRASLKELLQRALAADDKDTAAKIQFEIQSLGNGHPAPTAETTPATLTPEMTALQTALADTTWRINPDKTFHLQADGHSTSSWTPRHGRWKVIDATTVELDIGNIRRHEKVTVSQGATFLTWAPREADEIHPQVAKKIVAAPDQDK